MIDKKGRIFGKINIIDLVVVILVLCLLGGLIFNLKKKEKETAPTAGETGVTTITLKLYNSYPELLTSLKVGDTLIISDSISDFKIVEMSQQKSISTVTTETGEMITAEHPLFVDCTLVIEGTATKDALGITLGDKVIHINESFEVKTSSYYGSARVLDIQFEPAQ